MKFLVSSLFIAVHLGNLSPVHSNAIIGNSRVALGVRECAGINVDYRDVFGWGPSDPASVGAVGLRDIATGALTGLERGCLCEGWTAMVRQGLTYPIWCGDNASNGPPQNIAGGQCGFSGFDGATSATSTAKCTMSPATGAAPELIVTHEFQPSTEIELYEIKVTMTNPTDRVYPEVLYRRAMDWDIDLTPFNELVTIQGSSAKICPDVEIAHDNGFCDVDPNAPCSPLNFSGDAIDNGPSDHGAFFQFNLGPLGPNESLDFVIFYGISHRTKFQTAEQRALSALAAVGASVYSLGQSSLPGDTPTFMFGYKCCKDDEDWSLDCAAVALDPKKYCTCDFVLEKCPDACGECPSNNVEPTPRPTFGDIKTPAPITPRPTPRPTRPPTRPPTPHPTTRPTPRPTPRPTFGDIKTEPPINKEPTPRPTFGEEPPFIIHPPPTLKPTRPPTRRPTWDIILHDDEVKEVSVGLKATARAQTLPQEQQTNDEMWVNKNFDVTCSTDAKTLCEEPTIGKDAISKCPQTCAEYVKHEDGSE